jgi:Fe-S-cluster-containing hydrogenase component 2
VQTVSIDSATCDRSPACPARRVCPKGAIVPVSGGVYPGSNGYTVIEDLCVGCGICARVCPGGAVNLG